jgi:hypothetical protein
MKKLLMATVATIALTAGGAWAAEPAAHGGAAKGQAAEMKGQAAEMKGQAAGKAETTGSGAAAKSDADVKAGTEAKPGKVKSELPKAKSEGSKAQSQMKGKSETTGSGNETKSGADMKGNTSKSQTTGAGSDSNKAAEPKADSTRTPTGAAGQTGQPSSGSSANQGSSSSTTTATTGSNTGGAVSLTNEQKTKIRTTVIQAGSAPKIERSQINFSLNVGTVVPRSVRIATVPATLVEIHPAWRGFRYFVVADEIIIVEPDTLKIVAVLTV